MRKALMITSFILCAIAVFNSCKKSRNNGPAPYTGCRILTIKETPDPNDTINVSTYNFYYNDDGTVQRIYVYQPYYGNTYTKYFIYRTGYTLGNTIYYGQTTPSTTDTIFFDTQNRVTYISSAYSTYQEYDSIQTFQYDTAGNMIRRTMTTGYLGNTIIDSFQWQGKDIQYSSETDNYGSNPVLYYSYYSATAYNVGNITARLTDLERYGRNIYTAKHLMQASATPYNDTFYYANVVDTTGKLIAVTATQDGNVLTTTKITYECE